MWAVIVIGKESRVIGVDYLQAQSMIERGEKLVFSSRRQAEAVKRRVTK
jgi:hypothetical protein